MKPTFHVQAKLTRDDKVLKEWDDVHPKSFDTFDEAFHFHEYMTSSLREERPINNEIDELERLVIRILKKSGGEVELRIVKRVYTEEVLEHA